METFIFTANLFLYYILFINTIFLWYIFNYTFFKKIDGYEDKPKFKKFVLISIFVSYFYIYVRILLDLI